MTKRQRHISLALVFSLWSKEAEGAISGTSLEGVSVRTTAPDHRECVIGIDMLHARIERYARAPLTKTNRRASLEVG